MNKMMDSIVLLAAHPLAHVNAILNGTATLMLLIGFVLIKRGKVAAHRRVMLSAFGTSAAFLVCYLAYHVWPVGAQTTPFQGEGLARTVYLSILFSHIILAIVMLFPILFTIYYGLSDQRTKHRKLARWTYPIWLYCVDYWCGDLFDALSPLCLSG